MQHSFRFAMVRRKSKFPAVGFTSVVSISGYYSLQRKCTITEVHEVLRMRTSHNLHRHVSLLQWFYFLSFFFPFSIYIILSITRTYAYAYLHTHTHTHTHTRTHTHTLPFFNNKYSSGKNWYYSNIEKISRKKIIFFVTHARFSSFFDLKRGPKVKFFFTDWIKKYYIFPAGA